MQLINLLNKILAVSYSNIKIAVFVIVFGSLVMLMQYIFVHHLKKWIKAYNVSDKTYNRVKWGIYTLVIYFNIPIILRFIFRITDSLYPKFLFYIGMYPSSFYQLVIIFTMFIFLLYYPTKYLIKLMILIVEKIKNKKVKIIHLSEGRRKFLKKLGLGIPSVLLGYGIYGSIRNSYYIEIAKRVLKSKKLPDALNGFTIALSSDLHAGLFVRQNKLEEFAKKVNSTNCDILFLTGDFIDTSLAYLKELINALKKIKKPKYGMYACLGNHDLYSGYETISKALNDIGIKVLRNSNEKIDVNGCKLVICGLEDLSTGKASIKKTFHNSDGDFKILLCHQPYIFPKVASKTDTNLMLSGHTHGGQIVPLKIGGVAITPAYLLSKYLSGFYKEKNSALYVNRGFGVVGFPIRTGADPEITKLTLIKE